MTDGILEEIAALRRAQAEAFRLVARTGDEHHLEGWQRVRAVSSELGDLLAAAVAWGEEAACLSATGDAERAREAFEHAFTAFDEIGAVAAAAQVAGERGWLALTQGDLEHAAVHFSEEQQLVGWAPDGAAVARSSCHLGVLDAMMSDWDGARKRYETAERLSLPSAYVPRLAVLAKLISAAPS